MNYTHLGRTGLKVSRLCLGTMNFGDVTDEKTSARILDEALEAGINFIDTADVYGTEQSPDIQQGSGLSEEIIGRWLQQGGRRERIVLATKVYQPMGPGPNDRRLSAYITCCLLMWRRGACLSSPRSGSFPLSLRRIHSVLPAWRYTRMDGSLSPRWAICSEVLSGLSNPTAPVSR